MIWREKYGLYYREKRGKFKYFLFRGKIYNLADEFCMFLVVFLGIQHFYTLHTVFLFDFQKKTVYLQSPITFCEKTCFNPHLESPK